jgi:hypothetical protein
MRTVQWFMFSILYIKKIAGKIYFKKRTLIFAEVEENEEDREKLKQWLKKVDKRNFTKPPLRKTAFEKIKPCE